jgi:ATP-dependent Lon protease
MNDDMKFRATANGPLGAMTDSGTDTGGTPEIPPQLPILPVKGTVVFPGTVVPLAIGREKSKRLIDAVLAGNKLLGIFSQRRDDVDDPGLDDIYRVGTVAQVLKLLRLPDGSNSLLVHGVARMGVESIIATEPYWVATVVPHTDLPATTMQTDALAFNARQTAQKVMELSPTVPEEAQQILQSIEKPGQLADFLAANLSLSLVHKQELLETFDVDERLRKVIATLQNQLEILELARKINTDVRKEIDKSQRDYYLHEQMKAIRKELGEGEGGPEEVADIRKRIESCGMPEPVLREARRELGRLERLPAISPETGVVRDYLEWLAEMPWKATTSDNLDLAEAQRILDSDHHGLDKIKRRIIEYLAVRKLNPEGHGPILCFVGPPGVGKTSLGQSIARALGRKFIRIALGGVRDEADIRGHRRTYIGAIPGRIVQEIRKCGVNNPVIMLDELDKVGSDMRGDPGAALLELLDPEQNHSFTDHYLGVPFDMSNVLFIGTANYIDPVEPALKDRMEIVELSGYTTREKVEISEQYLVPRQQQRCGLAKIPLTISEDVLRFVIERYTREAGVRGLERELGALFRAVAALIARDKPAPSVIETRFVEEVLGPPAFDRELAPTESVPGVATGLAYTPVGGEIIFIEASAMPGRGGFTITGQLGDVMRESAQAALSLIRAKAHHWGLDLSRLSEVDLHIHIPAGAIPKDGPSAGVAMFIALFSLFTDIPASASVGMTGEITLRGLVLPIGGVKEKVLAAHRAGLRKVILPARNEPDLIDVPAEVRKDLEFVLVQRVEEALLVAIPGVPKTVDVPSAKKRRPALPTGPGRSRAGGRNAAGPRRSGSGGRS